MLAYKAWRESQVRVLVSAAALAWFCALFVIARPGLRQALDRPYAEFVEDQIYGGGIRNLFVIFILVLGLGGLLQERARGTAAFTLSLPVHRARLVWVRGAIGLLEVAGLAAVPSLVVSTLSPFVHQSYPIAEALRWTAQWAAGGGVLFAGAFFLSILLAGTYAALATSMAALLVYALLVNLPAIRRFPSLNVFTLMASARLEPMALYAAVAVTAAVVLAAAAVTERQDF